MIRRCESADLNVIYEIINDAAMAYKGIIPADRWHEPYMPMEELRQEIADGVEFWGYEAEDGLVGVMGIQDKGDVALIRHAYVRSNDRRKGVGTTLLRHIESQTTKPILVGTWVDAVWALRFYEKNGYRMLARSETVRLLRKYWHVPERQIATSIVLAFPRWVSTNEV
jgi:N-acetylglutamate synthase-like GNAT family acetyltransferase